MNDNYVRLILYGEKYSDLKQKGKYVFQDNNYKLREDTYLLLAILHYITNYNLNDLELFLRLSGINAFTLEEMPNSFSESTIIDILTDKKIESYTNEEEAKRYIEHKLGKGIINKYKRLKLEQLKNMKDKIQEQEKKLKLN